MQDRNRRSKTKNGVFDLDFAIRKKNIAFLKIRPDLMRDRKLRSKTKNGVFRSDFSIRKKNYLILRKKTIYFFLIEKSRSKNAVFRFRSAFSISHKIGSYLKKSYICLSDRKIQIEKRRFSFSINVFDLA